MAAKKTARRGAARDTATARVALARAPTPVERDDSIEELFERIKITATELDKALIDQPQAFGDVSDALAFAISRRDAAKDELRLVEARADADVRKDHKDEKLTETAIKNMVIQQDDVMAAQANLRDLELAVARLGGLKESFNQRSYAIKDLVSLYLAAYFSESSASVRNDVGDLGVSDVRRQQTAHRQSRQGSNRSSK